MWQHRGQRGQKGLIDANRLRMQRLFMRKRVGEIIPRFFQGAESILGLVLDFRETDGESAE